MPETIMHAKAVALTVAGVLATCATTAAQDPAAIGRRGSPVETLERMTGEGAVEFAQEPEREAEPDEIDTDRDSFTPATAITGRNRPIVESAYSFVDNRAFKETHSLPELLLRYGLSECIELRLGWGLNDQSARFFANAGVGWRF